MLRPSQQALRRVVPASRRAQHPAGQRVVLAAQLTAHSAPLRCKSPGVTPSQGTRARRHLQPQAGRQGSRSWASAPAGPACRVFARTAVLHTRPRPARASSAQRPAPGTCWHPPFWISRKMWSKARGMMPRSSAGCSRPSIVCVLPQPVCRVGEVGAWRVQLHQNTNTNNHSFRLLPADPCPLYLAVRKHGGIEALQRGLHQRRGRRIVHVLLPRLRPKHLWVQGKCSVQELRQATLMQRTSCQRKQTAATRCCPLAGLHRRPPPPPPPNTPGQR